MTFNIAYNYFTEFFYMRTRISIVRIANTSLIICGTLIPSAWKVKIPL